MTPLEAVGGVLGVIVALTAALVLVLRGESRRCESGKVGSCRCFPPEQQ